MMDCVYKLELSPQILVKGMKMSMEVMIVHCVTQEHPSSRYPNVEVFYFRKLLPVSVLSSFFISFQE